MDFFIQTAYAAAPGEPVSGSGFGTLILLAGFIVIFYFLLWRPQSKRAKQHRELLANLAKGDEVVTTGGMMGKISRITDDCIVLAIADNVEIKVQKPAIAGVLPKGTLKGENKTEQQVDAK